MVHGERGGDILNGEPEQACLNRLFYEAGVFALPAGTSLRQRVGAVLRSVPGIVPLNLSGNEDALPRPVPHLDVRDEQDFDRG